MNDSVTRAINISEGNPLPLKKCWPVAHHIVVVIDDGIVHKLGINKDDTYVEEQIIGDGILLKIKRIGGISE